MQQDQGYEPVAGMPADHRVTLAQIGRGALMNLGARDFMCDDEKGKLFFRIGSEQVYRLAVVTLAPSDTYTVQIGRVRRHRHDWVTEATVRDVYCDMLAETLIRLHHEVTV